ncbi:hypothetical protein F7734_54980 [Scytonema sp. UIC 10036]|uniref:hypothetical protein n=1 Tax=Scytonema sp. UIC 10036 TaxID=2304196 RepID=UPI0012DA9C76|nr:hypothetical protein [Scytonema sp. UIC 10036]MUH00896.1 hypothetical protein [Scytonema sp. UIC 10036]
MLRTHNNRSVSDRTTHSSSNPILSLQNPIAIKSFTLIPTCRQAIALAKQLPLDLTVF